MRIRCVITVSIATNGILPLARTNLTFPYDIYKHTHHRRQQMTVVLLFSFEQRSNCVIQDE